LAIDRALQLDPTSPLINSSSAGLHDWTREYLLAIKDARRALEQDPQFPAADWFVAIAYAQTGRYAEALAQLAHYTAQDSDVLGLRGYVLALSGQPESARRTLAEIVDQAARGYVCPSAVALIHASLGDKDAAFAWLERAYEERDYLLRFLKVAPYWDSLRSDPRFARLLQRLRLE
jgi:tetratricopeptide (TPR) repeat protein